MKDHGCMLYFAIIMLANCITAAGFGVASNMLALRSAIDRNTDAIERCDCDTDSGTVP